MAERFRRIKKEKTGLSGSFSRKKLWVLPGAVVLVFMGWFYWSAGDSSRDEAKKELPVDRALAAVVCRAGECFWLNREGVSFNKSGKTAGNLVMNLEDKTGRDLKVGAELLNPGVMAELFFLKQRIYEEFGVSLRMGEIDNAKLSDFNFITQEGWALKISIGQNAYKTLETLKQTLAEISKTNSTASLDYIDLRIPNKVYYKFR